MKKILLTAALAFAQSAAHADFLGFYAGAGYWSQSFGGDIQTFGTNLNIESDLGIDDSDGLNLFFAFEHPIPLIPNVRISKIELESSGSAQLQRNFQFGGETYTVGADSVTAFDLSHTEFLLYYEILDNWVTVDIGLSVKMFDGYLEITADGTTEREDLDSPLPMLYARAAFELPFTGWRADVEGHVLSLSGNTITDMSAEIAYEYSLGFGAELGYRIFSVDIDEFSDDLVVETDFDGIYTNVYYHF